MHLKARRMTDNLRKYIPDSYWVRQGTPDGDRPSPEMPGQVEMVISWGEVGKSWAGFSFSA
jgi:hypothetical protein